jgi:hypothetical protein
MKTIINEGLDYHDLKGQMEPVVSVDEYAAKMGKDKDVVTLAFIIKSKEAGKDLVSWFEKGYDYVLDASLSEGEVEVGKYLVFVEMNRRSKVPQRIVEMLSDLQTLTDLSVKDWTIKIDNEEYSPTEEEIAQVIILNPNEYKADKEEEEKLNEFRELAGISAKKVYSDDAYTKYIKSLAGM